MPSRTSTKLVNKTDKVLYFFVESSAGNYSLTKVLQPHSETSHEYDPNCTFAKLRMFDNNRSPTDIAITTDDMIDHQEISISEKDGRFEIKMMQSASGETSTVVTDNTPGSWFSSFILRLSRRRSS
ncbi:uncharacterized protein [Physcomitrium patens]|uniref:DUF7748 domain-containing protein n=1 Tax=Physcomitrium patens TaxID=3218 RepID=A9T175_PHYPA|nr:uncharacterized protein LOC112277755 [Physcomitrium patens]PNR26593.1 hypothetical protein PHYPA_030074 [Physcomitrium patens]|eukprot:XP_024366218.1 uncharacterized protein LOC112277755 [Physcomitrella patens]